MADKQLTVAELLARAEKENPSGPRRPRRRRSLEDGGVSVAELTDSFKKVDVKPAEVKHSSVPIDAPSDTPKKTPTQAPTPTPTPTPEPTPAPKPAPKPADRPAQAESVKLRPAAKPAEKPAAKPVAQAPKPAPAGSSVTKVQPATDDTTVLRKVEGKAEPVAKQKFSQPDDTGEIRTVDTPEPQQRADVEPLDAAEYDTDYEVEEAAVNPILLVLLVFFGVLLGVLGFLAFKWLWANAMAIVAVLVGVGVVAAVVAAVGAMASGRDKVTMIIAGLAAAVVVFGPALL